MLKGRLDELQQWIEYLYKARETSLASDLRATAVLIETMKQTLPSLEAAISPQDLATSVQQRRSLVAGCDIFKAPLPPVNLVPVQLTMKIASAFLQSASIAGEVEITVCSLCVCGTER